MRRSEKIKRVLLTAAIVLALAVFVGGVGYFGYLLSLRTGWKQNRLALASHFTQAYRTGSASVSLDGATLPADDSVLDYFLGFLLSGDTVVLRKEVSAADGGIGLVLPGAAVRFTPVGDGADTNVQWRSSGKIIGYTVHGVVAYQHLAQYCKNLQQAASD